MKRKTLLPLMAALALLSVLARPSHADPLSSAISRQRSLVHQHRSRLNSTQRQYNSLCSRANSIRSAHGSLNRQRARYVRARQFALWQQRMNAFAAQWRSVQSRISRVRSQYSGAQRGERRAVSEYNRLVGVQRQQVIQQRRVAEARRRAAWEANRRKRAAEARRRAAWEADRRRRATEARRREQLRQEQIRRQSQRRPSTSTRSTTRGGGTRAQQIRRAIVEGKRMLAQMIKTARNFEGPEPRFANSGAWGGVRKLRQEIKRLEALLSNDNGRIMNHYDKMHATYEVYAIAKRKKFDADVYIVVHHRDRTSRRSDDGLNEFKVVYQYFFIDTEKPASKRKTRMEYEERRVQPGESLASSLKSGTPKGSRLNRRIGKWYEFGGSVYHSSVVRVTKKR